LRRNTPTPAAVAGLVRRWAIANRRTDPTIKLGTSRESRLEFEEIAIRRPAA
jgi:hypothetical protein